MKTFGVCKVCSMVLSVPIKTTQTLNRQTESHSKKLYVTTATNTQSSMDLFVKSKHVPEKVSELSINIS